MAVKGAFVMCKLWIMFHINGNISLELCVFLVKWALVLYWWNILICVMPMKICYNYSGDFWGDFSTIWS